MSTISIPAILVNGFLNSGKTTYIHDCLKNDYFYKKGLTLLLSFEEGEIDYDLELLKSRNTELLTYSHSEDVSTFLQNALDTFSPDRVYVEMNAMIPELYETLSSLLRIDFSITLIEGTTFPLYLTNLRQFLQNMVKISHQVIFNRMSKEELEPYGNLFRVMSEKAAYLWEGPTGYHEKAFGVMVPFDRNADTIALSDADFTPFYLDALAAPEHYAGKKLHMLCQVARSSESSDTFRAGRRVMTCCAADIQFLSVQCHCQEESVPEDQAWILLTATGTLRTDRYGQKMLLLEAKKIQSAKPPKSLVIGLF